jgi:hypothetical protein
MIVVKLGLHKERHKKCQSANIANMSSIVLRWSTAKNVFSDPIGLLVSEEKIFKHISHKVLC